MSECLLDVDKQRRSAWPLHSHIRWDLLLAEPVHAVTCNVCFCGGLRCIRLAMALHRTLWRCYVCGPSRLATIMENVEVLARAVAEEVLAAIALACAGAVRSKDN